MNRIMRSEEREDDSRLFVRPSDSLRDTLEVFRVHRAMRLLAVVDEDETPVGVIREIDIRDLLFNPFGHALMSNPGFGNDITALIKDCAVAEYDRDSAGMIEIFSRYPDSPGLVLVDGKKFRQTLSGDRLLELLARGRIARAEQITQYGQEFTRQILELSGMISQTAIEVNSLSDSLGAQAQEMTNAAHNVATGAAQSSMGLQDVNERGRNLAKALEQLAVAASEAKMVRTRTRYVIDAAEPQMKALAKSGDEIGGIIDVIHKFGKQTNFLALNAQIEAVRQDSDNHGFVAVASEIKQLANQTKNSAQEVAQKAGRIGRTVNQVMTGHGEIVEAMEQISAISEQIDTAVVEQSATSLVIAGFVEQAADATSDISARANDIGARASQVHANAGELARVSALLLSSAKDISEHSRSFVSSIQYA